MFTPTVLRIQENFILANALKEQNDLKEKESQLQKALEREEKLKALLAQNEKRILHQGRRLAALHEANVQLTKQAVDFEKVQAKNNVLKQTIGIKEQEILKHLHTNVASRKALQSAQ